MRRQEGQVSASRSLLRILAVMYVLGALVYNEFLVGRMAGEALPAALVQVRWTQGVFLAVGVALWVLSEFVLKRLARATSSRSRRPLTKLLFGCLPVLALLSILEYALDPFAKARADLTTVFVEDDDLGWRLRPHADDVWGGVRVRINGKGLRGPEVTYENPAGVRRVLYLGDSVTFGYKLESHTQSFPYITGDLLEVGLGREVETINAGVGGYSPWQEFEYLKKEGLRYDPDLIVVSFVLNDVVEKLQLTRFGGHVRGWQLHNTVSGVVDRYFEESSIVYFARMLAARRRFGEDVQRGAVREELLSVRQLVKEPDDPDVREAWELTLESLDKIFNCAEEQGIPLILVSFPFVFQMKDVEQRSAPQRVLETHAAEHEVPMLDMLPLLVGRAKQDVRRPREYFLDADHLSPDGNEVAAQFLAEFILRGGWLAE